MTATTPAASVATSTAEHNRTQLQAMFDNLAVLAEGPGMSWDVIAERAGTTPEVAQRLTGGREDITISDLETVLVAVGARIWVDVEPDS